MAKSKNNTMKSAWEQARYYAHKYGGKASEYFQYALKTVWQDVKSARGRLKKTESQILMKRKQRIQKELKTGHYRTYAKNLTRARKELLEREGTRNQKGIKLLNTLSRDLERIIENLPQSIRLALDYNQNIGNTYTLDDFYGYNYEEEILGGIAYTIYDYLGDAVTIIETLEDLSDDIENEKELTIIIDAIKTLKALITAVYNSIDLANLTGTKGVESEYLLGLKVNPSYKARKVMDYFGESYEYLNKKTYQYPTAGKK